MEDKQIEMFLTNFMVGVLFAFALLVVIAILYGIYSKVKEIGVKEAGNNILCSLLFVGSAALSIFLLHELGRLVISIMGK